MAASDPELHGARIARNPRFDCVQLEDESILYDTETHNVIYLDASALVIWQLCDGERRLDEITRLIEGAYPASREAIADDVRRTVDALASSGALMLRA